MPLIHPENVLHAIGIYRQSQTDPANGSPADGDMAAALLDAYLIQECRSFLENIEAGQPTGFARKEVRDRLMTAAMCLEQFSTATRAS